MLALDPRRSLDSVSRVYWPVRASAISKQKSTPISRSSFDELLTISKDVSFLTSSSGQLLYLAKVRNMLDEVRFPTSSAMYQSHSGWGTNPARYSFPYLE